MRSKRLFRSSLLLALAVLVPLLSLNIPLAHAGSPNLFSNTTGTCSTDPCTITTTVAASSEIIITGDIIQNGNTCSGGNPTVSDSLGNSYSQNQYVIIGGGCNSNPSSIFAYVASSSGAGGSDIVTFHGYGGAGPFLGSLNIQDYTAFTGFGASSAFTSAASSGSDTRTLSIGIGSVIIGAAVNQGQGLTCGSITLGSGQLTLGNFACQTVSGQGSGGGLSTSSTSQSSSPYSDTLSWSGASTPTGFGRFVIELVGSGSGSSVASITQCYGNCGNPPITLANTNSTHTVNFNQTITLLYEFQSNVNGFLLNVTTSMAKSYATLPNGPAFGIYTIPSCGLGLTPFSPQCPGLLQAQSPGQNFFSPPKGKISFSGLHVPVANGQWVGIALSAFQSGLDVNDTNTNVNLFQTNEGKIPSSIQAASLLGNSKVGLWAWIIGNVVTGGQPPGSPSGGACGPGLDLILTCVVNSLCTTVTTQCQTGSSIFLIVILTIFSIGVMLGIFSYWLPGMNITTKGMGEFAVLIFIGWFVAFAAYGLLLPYMMILMFFVIAWLFLGRSKGTGPI